MANHEIDNLKDIWDILNDPDTAFTTTERTQQIEERIRERCAVLQIGTKVGWRAVPGSEHQEALEQLGIPKAEAAKAAAESYNHSFRGSSSGRGRRRSNKTPKK